MTHTKSIRWFLPLGLVFLISGVFGLACTPAQKDPTPVSGPMTDAAAKLKAYEKHFASAPESPFHDLRWQYIGPTNVSGRITDLAVGKTEDKARAVYAATASGGLWKSTDEGDSWKPLTENLPTASIGAVAVSASNPDIVWMGTGEANVIRSGQAGIGVFKSVDAGKTWIHMGLEATSTIARIVIHPENPDIVYVAAPGRQWTDNPERGVFMTSDGGRTWEHVLSKNPRTGANDLVMDPSDPDTLYASMWQRIRTKWNDPRTFPDYTGTGIHKTTDGGKTWAAINTGLPEPHHRGRTGLSIAHSNPNVIYAYVDNYEFLRDITDAERRTPHGNPSTGYVHKGATIYRSDDKGENWNKVSPLTPEMEKVMFGQSMTYGWYFGQIRVDPNDENTVYTSGIRFNVSRDGGKTFSPLMPPGVDHHGMWIDPDDSQSFILAFDQGLAITRDGGKTWKDSRSTLPVVQFYNLSHDMDTPFRVYGSVQDHGSFRGVVDLSKGRDQIPAVEFERAPGGEASTHVIDPTNPEIVYSAGFFGRITRTDYGKSGKERQTAIFPEQAEGEPYLRGQWLAPIAMSPHDPKTIYLGVQYLYRSRNMGDDWERISPDLTTDDESKRGEVPYQTIFAISESPKVADLIYVGTDDGRVHVTRDGGANWQEIVKGLPEDRWVSRIAASAFEEGTVYMTQNGKRDDDCRPYVWKSTDFGETWKDISTNLPIGPVNVIREDPFDKNTLYLGTDLAAYMTTDGGATWHVLGGNLPTTYVHDLVIHPRDNIIVIATHGRGMWALDAAPINKKE
ncbi:MAG: hypothetical protein SCM96_15755 [Acidobacteriota bacterium]|nr:hypothetical protein [Acidobacteriota bacterium]